MARKAINITNLDDVILDWYEKNYINVNQLVRDYLTKYYEENKGDEN